MGFKDFYEDDSLNEMKLADNMSKEFLKALEKKFNAKKKEFMTTSLDLPNLAIIEGIPKDEIDISYQNITKKDLLGKPVVFSIPIKLIKRDMIPFVYLITIYPNNSGYIIQTQVHFDSKQPTDISSFSTDNRLTTSIMTQIITKYEEMFKKYSKMIK